MDVAAYNFRACWAIVLGEQITTENALGTTVVSSNVFPPRMSPILKGSELLQTSVVSSIETQLTKVQAGNTRIVRRPGHGYQLNNSPCSAERSMYRMLYCGSPTPTCVLSGLNYVYSL